MTATTHNLYLTSVLKELRDYKALGDKTFAQLEEADFHRQPNAASNSIAIIIQHLHGNMLSRWTNFLTEDGEKEWRQRDEEFEVHTFTKTQLLEKWEEGWQLVIRVIESLTEEDLSKTIYIRTKPLLVIAAINRQLAHYPYHVGQIVYLGRWVKENAWTSLSIPKGNSQAYNDSLKKS
jgi:Protein of unknown function (DUF1572)